MRFAVISCCCASCLSAPEGCYPLVTNAPICEVQKQGLIWLREVKSLMADILDGKLNDFASITYWISAYDFFYRVLQRHTLF